MNPYTSVTVKVSVGVFKKRGSRNNLFGLELLSLSRIKIFSVFFFLLSHLSVQVTELNGETTKGNPLRENYVKKNENTCSVYK